MILLILKTRICNTSFTIKKILLGIEKYMKVNNLILLSLIIFVFSKQYAYCDNFKYGYTSSGYKYVIHNHSESSYQHVWCSQHNGIEEFKNPDKTRVDCLTDTHATEFDFANKWAESVGQALHYSKMTGKRAKVVLILENPKKQMCYYERVKNLSKIHDFDSEFVTPEILNLQNGKCSFKNCKCNRKKKKISFFSKIFKIISNYN